MSPGESRPLSYPVVALHASAGSGKQWNRLRERCVAGRFLAPDFHDHGAGPAWKPTESILHADVRLAVQAIDRCGGPVHLVGHSYGGAVALHAALARPGAVRSLVLYEPVAFDVLLSYNPRHAPAVEILEVGRAIIRAVMAQRLLPAAQKFITYWSGEAAWQAMPTEAREAVAKRMPAVGAHFRGIFAEAARVAALSTLRVPMLLAEGGRSKRPTRRVAELLQWLVPHARAVRLEQAGHMGPVTHAAEFLEHALGFLHLADAREPMRATYSRAAVQRS